jgi:hypothetical protein
MGNKRDEGKKWGGMDGKTQTAKCDKGNKRVVWQLLNIKVKNNENRTYMRDIADSG